MDASVSLSASGPLELTTNDQAVHLTSNEAKLLAVLAASGRELTRFDRLATALWPTTRPSSWRKTIQTHVWSIQRKSQGIVVSSNDGYRLDLEAVHVDVIRLGEFLDLSRAEHSVDDRLRRLVDAWRDEPFAELADDADFSVEAERARRSWWMATELVVLADLSTGVPDRALPRIGRLVEADPVCERARGLLALALSRTGNSHEALRELHRARTYLRETVGAEPTEELRRIERLILDDDPQLRDLRLVVPFPPPIADGGPRPQREPVESFSSRSWLALGPGDAFFGRSDELAELSARCAPGRIVAVCGTAGAGKTRLAREAAQRLWSSLPDGIWDISLPRELAAPEALAYVADVLGASIPGEPSGPAIDRWANARDGLVLVHDLEGVPEIAHDLAAAFHGGSMRLLLTSRLEPTDPTIEVLELDPLPTGRNARAASCAAQLFADRAHLSIDSASTMERSTIDSIVDRLDGLPLAIELVAAQAVTIGCVEVDRLLGHDRGAVADEGACSEPPGSLDHALRTSWTLLGTNARRALTAFATCDGGCTIALASELCAAVGLGTDDAIAAMAELERAHLLLIAPPEPRHGRPDDAATAGPRVRLLAGVQTFARSNVSDENGAAGRAHSAYFSRLAARFIPEGMTSAQLEWTRTIDVELPNLLLAARNLTAMNRMPDAAALVGDLAPIALEQGRSAVLSMAEHLYESDVASGNPHPRLCLVAAWAAFRRGELDVAAERADAGFASTGRGTVAELHQIRASVHAFCGEFDAMVGQCRAGIAAAIDDELPHAEALNRGLLGTFGRFAGADDLAENAHRLRQIAAVNGSSTAWFWAHLTEGYVRQTAGDITAAVDELLLAATHAERMGAALYRDIARRSLAQLTWEGDPVGGLRMLAALARGQFEAGDLNQLRYTIAWAVAPLAALERWHDVLFVNGVLSMFDDPLIAEFDRTNRIDAAAHAAIEVGGATAVVLRRQGSTASWDTILLRLQAAGTEATPPPLV